MKKLILVFAIIIPLLGYSQFTKDELKEIKSILPKGVRGSYDMHEGILWIKSKKVDIQRVGTYSYYSDMHIYFGISKIDGKHHVMPVRIVNSLSGSDWIFFNEISFLVGGKKEMDNATTKKFLLQDESPLRTVVGGGVVNEKSDVICSDEMLGFVNCMINTPKTIRVRYSGSEGYCSVTNVFVSSFPKNLKPLIDAHEILSKKYSD